MATMIRAARTSFSHVFPMLRMWIPSCFSPTRTAQRKRDTHERDERQRGEGNGVGTEYKEGQVYVSGDCTLDVLSECALHARHPVSIWRVTDAGAEQRRQLGQLCHIFSTHASMTRNVTMLKYMAQQVQLNHSKVFISSGYTSACARAGVVRDDQFQLHGV